MWGIFECQWMKYLGQLPYLSALDIEELSESSFPLMNFTQSNMPAIIEDYRGQGRILTWAVPYPILQNNLGASSFGRPRHQNGLSACLKVHFDISPPPTRNNQITLSTSEFSWKTIHRSIRPNTCYSIPKGNNPQLRQATLRWK